MLTRATRCRRPLSDPRLIFDSTRYSRPCQTGQRNAKHDRPLPALKVKNGPLAGKRLPVITPVTLGREDVDVLMDAPMVSRRHAVVRPVDGGLEIDDLGSTNGTWVNGERIEGATL